MASPTTDWVSQQSSRTRWPVRSILAAVFLITAIIATPFAVLTGSMKPLLTDTEVFVSTFSPLADEPPIRAMVQEATADAIVQTVDIQGLTGQLFSGLDSLNLSSEVLAALGLLEAPTAQSVESLIHQTVEDVVQSEAFDSVWRQLLVTSHEQFVSAMNDTGDAAFSVTENGELGLNVGPVVSQIRQNLVESGVRFAATIPDIDSQIPLAQSDTIRQTHIWYPLIAALGTWLPVLTVLLTLTGLLMAVNRRVALIRFGAALGVIMIAVWTLIGVGRSRIVEQMTSGVLSPDAAALIYDTAVKATTDTVVAIGVGGVIVAAVMWLMGVFRRPHKPAAAGLENADERRDETLT